MHLRHIQPNATRMKRLLDSVRAHGVRDPLVLEAMARVPRELFVSRSLAAEAYDDRALPIGEQQTISMPTVVARMTEALQLTGKEKVLEIGTGCGYQTAILCRLARRVFSIERRKALSDGAVARLQAMGYTNFAPLVGDGTLGWPSQAPFDAIVVTAAGPKIPTALTDQLAPGGRLVIPVGPQENVQQLVRVVKGMDGQLQQEILGNVVFVPLVGEQGVALKRA
ncbi:MAG: protein-L-isoaspartate(D-aspartate) O-methyltransferase [Proteobacteria bacterium]|nr:protein-L-isoaspartate(D-aspartate) O-methyltransferase [Pseudomonadota bacterium]